jgi:hypothetical protein
MSFGKRSKRKNGLVRCWCCFEEGTDEEDITSCCFSANV